MPTRGVLGGRRLSSAELLLARLFRHEYGYGRASACTLLKFLCSLDHRPDENAYYKSIPSVLFSLATT